MNIVLAALGAAILLASEPKPLVRISTPDISLSRWRYGVVLIIAVPLLLVAPAITIVVMLVAGTLIKVVYQTRKRAHQTHIAAATSRYVGFVLGDVRAGSAMPHALQSAVTALQQQSDVPQEVLHAAIIAARRASCGAPAAGVFVDARQRCPDLGMVGVVWNIAEQHGIPLVELLEQTQARIDARLRHRAATAAALQGPQATAVILTLLPVAGLLLGSAMGADPLGFLFSTGIGGILLVFGVALTCGGFLWSRAIFDRAAP